MKRMLSPFLATLLLFLTAMIWGLGFSAQKSAGELLGSFSIVCIRSAVATLALFLVVLLFSLRTQRPLFARRDGRLRLDISKTEWIGGALCGLALAAASVLQQLGMILGTDAGKASFITSLYIVFVPLLGLFYGRRTSFPVLLGILAAVAGAFLLAFDPASGAALGFSVGDISLFGCAVVYAVQIIVIDRFSPRCDGTRMSMVQFAVCSLVALPFALIFERETLLTADFGTAILPLLYLGVFSSGVGYTLQILAQKGVHPAVACAVLSLESVFGLLFGMLLHGERLGTREWIGCAVLFAAVVYTQLVAEGKKKGEPNEADEIPL